MAPFLAGIQNEEQYTQALELVDHLLLNDPENPLLDLVCAKITAWGRISARICEFNAIAPNHTWRYRRDSLPAGSIWFNPFDLEMSSKSMVSRVLSGKRKLTLEHASKNWQRDSVFLPPCLLINATCRMRRIRRFKLTI